VFCHISKHLKVSQKYSALLCIFNSLLCVGNVVNHGLSCLNITYICTHPQFTPLGAYFCPFRNGMFTTSQLSNFSLLLHYLSTTQTLFGDNLPLLSLDGCFGGGSEDSLNIEGCIVSIFQFHQSFIDYCIRLRLVNLLYHYLDFYRLVQTYFIAFLINATVLIINKHCFNWVPC